MAVYTEVPDDELAAFIASYDVDGSCPPKASPRASRTPTTCGTPRMARLIPAIYEKRIEQANLPFFFGLMDHFARPHACPTPVHDTSGQTLRTLGRPYTTPAAA